MKSVALALFFVWASADTLVEYHTSSYRCLCTRRSCVYAVVRVAGGKRDTLEVSSFDYEPQQPMPWPAHLSKRRKVER